MFRTIAAVIFLFTLALMPASQAMAQPVASESSFQSELIDGEIDLGPSGEIEFLPEQYDFTRSGSFREEFIYFSHGGSNFELMLVYGPTNAQEYHDVTMSNLAEYYEDWQVIDEEVNGTHSRFFATGIADGQYNVAVFYEYEEDVVGDIDLGMIQFSYFDTLESDLAFVQDEVTVAGEPIFPDTDPAEIAALFGDGGAESTPTTGNDSETEPTETEEADTTGSPDRTQRTSRTTTSDDDEESSGTGVTRTSRTSTESTPEATQEASSGGIDWEEQGLVSDSEWESPSFGVAVVWDTTDWYFPEEYEEAIYIGVDPPYDVLTLETVDGLGYVFVSVEDAGETTPLSLADYWASPEFSDTFDSGIEVIEVATTPDTVSVVYQTTNTQDQDLFVVLNATFLDSGEIVYSRVSASPTGITTVYQSYADGVTVNGAPIDLTFTPEEIIELSGN